MLESILLWKSRVVWSRCACICSITLFYVYNKKMSESEGLEINGGELQDFTIDQLAGALALSLGAVGAVAWETPLGTVRRVVSAKPIAGRE